MIGYGSTMDGFTGRGDPSSLYNYTSTRAPDASNMYSGRGDNWGVMGSGVGVQLSNGRLRKK